ncbi:Membrane protein involved in the export of O-antigen and teichoic acid [Roseovarius nanhaiticus]|uniref:Membrane protein involved in the export of O-antigen and teichoic acid n=1 Tax=Roseovarius nanhaiticus TaxID=573024 RepID=A0A1N7HIM6_9RHOB|nr:oligosaccharide flippase family protein [Roseovarius nanhaiticus]SEK91535.1 Membrane protein involved in the export of O-antigen and teichoic acid [Roseovarius nanhaiticus]SIS24736.1 Membrane protein involved in the export of O-antigen and teichoic acid [Roseovarius nanhaiticus]
MKRLTAPFIGGQLTARILRSASWVMMGYGGAQALRLASNLILTRLLFPEAFGLMTLVTVVTVGLMMFSDVGIGPSISQSKRGDDPDFLNTAWTIQVMRGLALWAVTLALAVPMARIYDEPALALYLPIAGIALVISGFFPTRIETAHRHLVFGRLTALDLAAQAIGVIGMIVLAVLTQSVIALVLGSVLTALAKLILTSWLMPGAYNRFRLEPAALHEQVHFGKWIFLSTAFTFLSVQGDKAILGALLDLRTLGIYNIGFFLASFPVLLGGSVAQQLLIPVYRDRPPGESAANRARLRRMRFVMTGGVFSLLAIMALAGPWLVALLYDPRYAPAGAMLVLIALAFVPQAIGLTYDRAALAAGNSRGVFVYSALRAVLQVAMLYGGFQAFGLIGALVAMGVALLIAYPVLVRLARRHQAWDALHDAVFGLAGLALVWGSLHLHWAEIAALAGAPAP